MSDLPVSRYQVKVDTSRMSEAFRKEFDRAAGDGKIDANEAIRLDGLRATDGATPEQAQYEAELMSYVNLDGREDTRRHEVELHVRGSSQENYDFVVDVDRSH